MSEVTDRAIKSYIDRAVNHHIEQNGMRMTKKISSGSFLSESVYDNRTVYSSEAISSLMEEGFSVNVDMGAWLYNALNMYDPEEEDQTASEPEQIARWLENLHCTHWNKESGGCTKSNCKIFRNLAKRIRNGEYK